MRLKSKYILLLFFMLLFFGKTKALFIDQDIKPDSIFEIANSYFYVNTDSAKIMYDKALTAYLKKANLKGEMMCLTRICAIYDDLGNTDTALAIAYRAINIGLTNSYDTLLAETYLRLGNIYKEIGRYNKSKEFYYKAINIGLYNTMNGAWGALGILYSNIGEYDSARLFLQKSINYFETKDTSSQVVLFNISSLYGSLGINSFDLNKPKDGLKYFKESLRISRKLGNESNIISNLLNLSIAYDMDNRPSESERVLADAYEIANRIGNHRLRARVFLLMSDHYYEIKNYESAYDYLTRYQVVNDSLGKVDFQKSLHENEVKYLKQIQEMELNKIELEKEKNRLRFFIIFGISSILFLFITFFLFRKVKIKTKEKRSLEKKSEKLSYRLRKATSQLLEMGRHIEEQNQLIIKLQQDAVSIDTEEASSITKELENRKILLNDDWEKYVNTFNILHPKFLSEIQKQFNNLSEGDKRQLIMLKLNYPRKKAALILGISPDSVKRAQQRLAKKLNLKDITELNEFVNHY